MNRGRAIILNPSRPDSIKRREFLLDSLTKSALAFVETVEESRIVIEWQGEPKPTPARAARRSTLPPPMKVERALKSRLTCEPDEVEYWEEMIRLTSEREGLAARTLKIRTGPEQWADTWAVGVGEHLAVNRVNDSWAITHVGTGMRAALTSTFHEALATARNVATWPEWAAIHQASDITPEFKQKARAAFGVAA